MSEIEPFLPGTVPFSQHLEQLNWIFVHHKVDDPQEKKVAFLASCNTEVYTELKMIFPDRDLKLVPYKDICDALCKRYDQCESILRRRYKFYRREQGSSESAEDFIRAVKQLAERCDFGGFKSEAIRDRLVFGINDRDLQKRLMDKGDLTLRETEQLMLNDDILGSRSGQLSPVSSLDDHDVGSFGGSASKQSNSAVMKSVKRSRSPSVLRAGSVDRRKSMAPRAPQMKKVITCTHCRRVGHTRRYCFDLKRDAKVDRLYDDILRAAHM